MKTAKTVDMLLMKKGRDVWSIAPSATVYEAIEMMNDRQVGALPVMEGGELRGMLSERDYARKVILQGRSSRECRVDEIMTREVICVDAERKIEECMAVMTEKKIRHLPVKAQGQVVGIVSIGDLVKAIIEEQEFLIQQLESYITG